MRRLVALALAVMLVLSSVATADAATVKRTWTARVGKDAVNGTARMQAFTKVLFVSGYAENAIVRRGVLDPETSFLAKPFSPDALAARVRQVLDAS